MCMSLYGSVQVATETRGVSSFWICSYSGYEPPEVGAGYKACVTYKNSMQSLPLSHLSSLQLITFFCVLVVARIFC